MSHRCVRTRIPKYHCPVTGDVLVWQCYRCGVLWEEHRGKLRKVGKDRVILPHGMSGLREEPKR